MASDRNNFAICLCLICVLFVMSCSTSKSQNKPESLLSDYDINANIKIAEIDNLGRIYLVTDKNILINYRPDFKEMYRHANTKSGAISSIDVSNPLKINPLRVRSASLRQVSAFMVLEKQHLGARVSNKKCSFFSILFAVFPAGGRIAA